MHCTKYRRHIIQKKEVYISLSVTIGMDVSKQSEYLDYEWSIALNRFYLKVYGVWPDNDDKKLQKWMLDARVFLVIIIMVFSSTVPTLHSLVRIWGDIMLMVDNLQVALPFSIAILKLFLMWWKKKELVPILKMVKEDWLKSKTEEERSVMLKRARIARTVTICGYIIISLLFFFFVILPFFGISFRYLTNVTDPGKIMPIQSYYIYDTDKTPFYEITFILQGISVISAGAMYAGTDNLLGLLIFHICGQLENLKAHILRLDKSDFEKNLSDIVRNHKRLTRSIKIIDNVFTIMMLGLLIYFGFQFALYGFILITITSHNSDFSAGRFTFIISSFLCTFTYMCFYCILGEILVIQGEGIYDAVCEYEWYKLQPNKAKDLMMIMIRANKPLYLTAGKLFPMTMSTFCNMLKTSGGYISFLAAHRE